jgi:anti-sigma regulatory factor (Ser/Thr protein kinase)
MSTMDIKSLILERIKRTGKVSAADIIRSAGFSRTYINRFFQELRNEGRILLIGMGRKAYYISADKEKLLETKKTILAVRKKIKNEGLSDDVILEQIKRDTGIFIDLPKNIADILDYAFTEMVNNAIEHSQSKEIEIKFERDKERIKFDVIDSGIGIFNNIMRKKGLTGELEAVQDLLKGKQTTAPMEHSGEGIFFTSKVADTYSIASSNKKLIFDNLLDDIFVQDSKFRQGTKVSFAISIASTRDLKSVFEEYSENTFEFDTTKVAVRLYKMGDIYVSRSQARRIMTGLDKFKKIILDFAHIKTVGQAFADQIFRVWHNEHPDIAIEAINSNENIEMMINRAHGSDEKQLSFEL